MNNRNLTTSTPDQPSGDGPFVDALDDRRCAVWDTLGLDKVGKERLLAAGTHTDSEVARLVGLASELDERITADGPATGLTGFVTDADTHRGRLERLAVINTVEHVADLRPCRGVRNGLDALALCEWVDPDNPHQLKRPLVPLEAALVRYAALVRSPQHAATVAVGEAGAASGETTVLTAAHVDPHTFEVLLPGGVDGLADRVGVIAGWARPAVAGIHASFAASSSLLLYGGRSEDPDKIESAILMNATNVFRSVGLGTDPRVSYMSLRATGARAVYDSTGNTDEVVKFLGNTNFNLAREQIGVDPTPRIRRRTNKA